MAEAPDGTTAARFLERYLRAAPQYPSGALLRSWEGALFSRLSFAEPLLDLGCGDGNILESLLDPRDPPRRPQQVYGLDINTQSAAIAAGRPTFRGVVVADARRQPYPTATFACVVSVCVLEHIPGVEAVLAEVSRVLRLGGLFAFSVPTPAFLETAARTHPRDPNEYVRTFNERVEHRTVWDAGTWTNAVEAAGLQVRDMRGFMPPEAAEAWFSAYDWAVRPIRGRGVLYRWAGPGLRRFGLGRALASYWYHRLAPWAERGAVASIEDACALFVVAGKAGG
jgi:SAM-dependent methyltransferase